MDEDIPYGWGIIIDPDTNKPHIVPTHDTYEHYFVDCNCVPRLEDDGAIIVHNSYDGRESFETDERKKS